VQRKPALPSERCRAKPMSLERHWDAEPLRIRGAGRSRKLQKRCPGDPPAHCQSACGRLPPCQPREIAEVWCICLSCRREPDHKEALESMACHLWSSAPHSARRYPAGTRFLISRTAGAATDCMQRDGQSLTPRCLLSANLATHTMHCFARLGGEVQA